MSESKYFISSESDFSSYISSVVWCIVVLIFISLSNIAAKHHQPPTSCDETTGDPSSPLRLANTHPHHSQRALLPEQRAPRPRTRIPPAGPCPSPPPHHCEHLSPQAHVSEINTTWILFYSKIQYKWRKGKHFALVLCYKLLADIFPFDFSSS